MKDPDYVGAVYAASWPHQISADGKKTYFVFQLLNDSGMAADVFYRNMALAGSEEIMLTTVQAYMQRRQLMVFLMDLCFGME